MQNIDLDSVIRTSKIPLGFSSELAHGFVDLIDVAAVVRKVILNPREHNMARYELVAENISYDMIAGLISEVLRRQITCDPMTPKDYLSIMNTENNIRNEYTEDCVIRLLLYYDRWGLSGNSNNLRWLLGRQPTKWDAYLRRELRR